MFNKEISMRVIKPVLTLIISGAVYLISAKLLLVIALFAAGTIIETVAEKGKDFKGEFAFHRCCAAIQWALMSF